MFPLELVFSLKVSLKKTAGVHWMHTLQVGSGNLNFLEGCYHAYLDGNNEFPGVVISTGTEGFIYLGWKLISRLFWFCLVFQWRRIPSSRCWIYSLWTYFRLCNLVCLQVLHNWVVTPRFHDMDPLWFNDGFQLIWRNGDMLDPSGS